MERTALLSAPRVRPTTVDAPNRTAAAVRAHRLVASWCWSAVLMSHERREPRLALAGRPRHRARQSDRRRRACSSTFRASRLAEPSRAEPRRVAPSRAVAGRVESSPAGTVRGERAHASHSVTPCVCVTVCHECVHTVPRQTSHRVLRAGFFFPSPSFRCALTVFDITLRAPGVYLRLSAKIGDHARTLYQRETIMRDPAARFTVALAQLPTEEYRKSATVEKCL